MTLRMLGLKILELCVLAGICLLMEDLLSRQGRAEYLRLAGLGIFWVRTKVL